MRLVINPLLFKNSFKRWQWRTLILCWAAYACIYFGRVNLSVAIPEIQSFLNISKAQIGILGSLFFWIYGIGQLINGYIGDRVSTRLFIFIGLFVAAAANLLFGFATGLTVMCILWAVNGLFQSMLWGPIAKTITHWVSPKSRSSAIIGVSTSMVAGFLLSWGLSGKILRHSSWNWLFWTPGIVILIFSVIWLLFMRNHPKDVGFDSPEQQESSTCPQNTLNNHQTPNNSLADTPTENLDELQKMSLWQVIKKTRLWFIIIACLAQGVVKDSINLWAPTFFMETHNLDINATAGLIIVIPIMNFFGMMATGWLNRKLKYKDKLTTIVLFVLGIAMIYGLNAIGGKNIFLGIFFLGASSAMMYGANTMLLGVIPMSFAKYNKVSTIAGGLDFFSYLAAGCAAALTGLIVDLSGWGGVMIFWIAVTALGTLTLLLSQLSDKKKVPKIIPENT